MAQIVAPRRYDPSNEQLFRQEFEQRDRDSLKFRQDIGEAIVRGFTGGPAVALKNILGRRFYPSARATQIQEAFDDANAEGGAQIILPDEEIGLDDDFLTIYSNLWIKGGPNTVITQASGSDLDCLIKTYNFDALINTSSVGGVSNIVLEDFMLDGDRANNTDTSGLLAYWFASQMRNVWIIQTPEYGIYEEHGTFGDTSPYNDPSNRYYNVRVDNAAGPAGWLHNGPHDSLMIGCSVTRSRGFAGLRIGPRGDGLKCYGNHGISQVQTGQAPEWSVVVDADNVFWEGSTAEGGSVGQLWVRGLDFTCKTGSQYNIVNDGTQTLIGVRLGRAVSVSSITRSGTTATVTTATDHELLSASEVTIAGAVETDYNGEFTITVTGPTTFTYTVSGSPTTPATGTITAKMAAAGYDIQTKIVNMSQAVIDFEADDGIGKIDVTGFTYEAAVNLISGTHALNSNIEITTYGTGAGHYSYHPQDRDYRARSYTATQIADKTHAVNTARKAAGVVIYDSTNTRLMVAVGSTDTSNWAVVDGSATVTPA